MTRILVVEDEESYLDALTIGLAREGFEVTVARDGVEALDLFRSSDPELILLDVMLPRMSGVDVCREIRKTSSVPIVMVTAKDGEVDTVVGLEVGADDYVTKPYRIRELTARMRAVMRRASGQPSPAPETSSYEDEAPLVIGDVSIDSAKHEVLVRGEVVSLPLREFELLEMLMENVGRVLTRQVLIDRLWGHDYVGDTKTLDVHIKRLRARIEDDPSRPTRITTIRGLGYRYDLPPKGA